MPRFAQRSLLFLTLIAVTAVPAHAQEEGATEVTLSVSPSFVNIGQFGGFVSLVAQLRVRRSFSAQLGGEFSAFSMLLAGGGTADAACTPGGGCGSSSTPNMLNGALATAFAFLGQSGFRASAGMGAVQGLGGSGPEADAGLAGVVGLDWESRSTSRFRPAVGIRVVQMARSVSGARTIFLPGVGVAF